MKKLITGFFAVLFISSVQFNNVYSQGFNSIVSPDGIHVIAVGNDGLVFRSINSGNSWSSYVINSEDLRSVSSAGNDVWIAGQSGNVHKTGKTNSAVSTYNTGSAENINSIVFIDTETGYLCGDNGIVYKSVNGGVTWSVKNTGIANIKLNSISFIDAMKGIVVGDQGQTYTTVDGGTTWTAEQMGTTRNLLKAKYFTDGIVVTGEYGVIISKQNGGVWNNIVTRTNSDIRGVTGIGVNDAAVCGGGGFIRNNKNGSANFFNFEINPMMANLTDIFYYDNLKGFAVSSLNKAIIRTTNGGVSWDLPAGTTVTQTWAQKSPNGSGIGNTLCMHPTDRNSTFVVYGTKVYVSRDKGDTWNQIANIGIGSRAHSFYVSPVDTNIWMAAMQSSPDKVVRSTDYGLSWSTILSMDFTTYGQPLEMDQNDPSNYYFVPTNTQGSGLYRSTDNGASFNLVAPYNNTSIGSPCDIIVMWDNSDVLFIGDDGADIYKTTNRGVNWYLVKPGSSSEIPSMCNSVFDQNICYATTWSSSQVFKTINKGETWNITSNNSGSGWGSDLCREDPTVVLTGNYGAQSYLTTNGGTNFFNVNSGLSGAGAGILVPDRSYLLNMQTGSLFKMVITYSVITNFSENTASTLIPEKFELFQNYPNPFNPVTNIKFSLPENGNISLKIFDKLGKEVENLADGYRNAGTYEINFDASGLSSGVYFYKIVTNNFVSTKKMVLVK
ncbi:MAG TPA: T9SS type A sorting domain-containing protein [Ignavibacteria bacterium]|nr:T9SS type A sorting domain-containing protein [Ignavibacteria bacterium]HRK00170.1 T9SS type A sorting domain-containing protein [Ignavibacteria bacterium]